MTTLQTLSDLRKQYPKSWLLEYIEKAKSGEEIIGNELMMMLDILLGHFENPTAIFPDGITFDTSESDTRIKFIETKIKHFEAPFAGKPFILTLRQKAYIEAFIVSKFTTKRLDVGSSFPRKNPPSGPEMWKVATRGRDGLGGVLLRRDGNEDTLFVKRLRTGRLDVRCD